MVRAKFKVVLFERLEGDLANISLSAVYEGSEENKEFFKWTPAGTINLSCVNPLASEQFIEGKEYYVDFSPTGE